MDLHKLGETLFFTPANLLVTVPSVAMTVLDTANAFTHTTINPVYFTVCAVVGVIFASFVHMFTNEASEDDDEQNYTRNFVASAFSVIVGFVPGLATIERTNIFARFFFSSSVVGFRLGVITANAAWHALHLKRSELSFEQWS